MIRQDLEHRKQQIKKAIQGLDALSPVLETGLFKSCYFCIQIRINVFIPYSSPGPQGNSAANPVLTPFAIEEMPLFIN